MWWGPEEVAKAVTAATGTKCTAVMLNDAHRRRRLLEFAYIKLCERAFGEMEEIPFKIVQPRPDGRFKGAVIDLGKVPEVTSRYYELMCIDPWTRQPTRQELERLGMKDVADTLEKAEEKAAAAEEAPTKSPKRRKRKK
jgi:aldehyde:ferredoxin oxidoreductase